MTHFDPALGWIIIGVVVAAWDWTNNRSLSDYAQKHWKWTAVIGSITLAHLTGILPDVIDPFHRIAQLFGR